MKLYTYDQFEHQDLLEAVSTMTYLVEKIDMDTIKNWTNYLRKGSDVVDKSIDIIKGGSLNVLKAATQQIKNWIKGAKITKDELSEIISFWQNLRKDFSSSFKEKHEIDIKGIDDIFAKYDSHYNKE